MTRCGGSGHLKDTTYTNKHNKEQDMQRTYNVTMSRVHETIVAVEKQ